MYQSKTRALGTGVRLVGDHDHLCAQNATRHGTRATLVWAVVGSSGSSRSENVSSIDCINVSSVIVDACS